MIGALWRMLFGPPPAVPMVPAKPNRVCRQCGREYPPRTMMESILHRATPEESASGKRNSTIGVFCPADQGEKNRCASYFVRDHPRWWEEAT